MLHFKFIKKQNIASALLSLVLLLSVLIIGYTTNKYLFLFGGDPDIHLVFADNLINGYPLQFNKGYYTSGETSIIYMLLVSFFTLVSGFFTPFFMKLVGFLSFIFFSVLVFKSLRRNRFCKKEALTLTLAFSSIPFILFQAMLGMENILFACISLYYIDKLMRGFEPKNIQLTVLPLLFLLRPEAIFLIAVYLFAYFKRLEKLIYILLGCLIAFACFYFIEYITGVPLHSAGMIRRIISYNSSFAFGNKFYINYKPLIAVIYFWPFLFLYYCYGFTAKFSRLVLLFMFLVPLFLHFLNILPSVQYTRYFVYSAFSIIYLATYQLRPAKNINIIICLYLLVVGTTELYLRSNHTGNEDVRTSSHYMDYNNRISYTDSFIRDVSVNQLPIRIALQEVQLKLRFDDRVEIWSLDGITDSSLANFVHDGYFDHVSYLKFRNVQYLIGTVNYNVDKSAPSLTKLNALKQGESLCIDDLLFKRLAIEIKTEGAANPEPIYELSSCEGNPPLFNGDQK